jgi:glycosyltransferase involved in cell wall biosynthesis
MKLFFSIIIPTYNRSEKLKKTITSVLDQTFQNFEVIVVDDGSTDDTHSTVLFFKDPRIIYRRINNFGGPSRPRNVGLGIAKGEWICFLDADDTWKKIKLEKCFNKISDNVDFIYHNLTVFSEGTHRSIKKSLNTWQVQRPVITDLLINGNPIPNSSVVVRKSVMDKIGEINESKDMIGSEDFNTWMRISLITENFLYLPEELGTYLIHEEGLTQKEKSINSAKAAAAEFENILNEKEKKRFLVKWNYAKARLNYLNGNYCDETRFILINTIKFGKLNEKVKSIYMLVLIKIHDLSFQ